MQIQRMLLAAQTAVERQEVPTVEQVMALSAALHAITIRMPEFLWFDKTFEDMGDTAYLAGQAAKRDENEFRYAA